MIRRIVALALVPLLAASPGLAQTVVIVRHAEKAAPSGDPDLSPTGQVRAKALAQALSGGQVVRVLVTPLKRTGQTGQPTALAAGVEPVAVPFDGGDQAHAQRLADLARAVPVEATVLIVGHSNTVGNIARALGDPAPEAITDCDYDKMTVIQLNGTAPPTVVHARYGAPTTAC